MSKHYQYIETDGDEITVHMTADQLKSLMIDADGDEDRAADMILAQVLGKISSDARHGGHTRTVKRRKKNNEDCDHCIYKMEADDE